MNFRLSTSVRYIKGIAKRSYTGIWVWHHHDYFVQSVIFLDFFSIFHLSLNWLELVYVDYTPISLYRTMNHIWFNSKQIRGNIRWC